MLAQKWLNWGVISAAVILMSGCSIASGMTEQEKSIRDNLAPSQYQPASRQARDAIETQDNFAQAAFWSREYQLNPGDLEAAIKLSAAVRKMGNPAKALEITQTSRSLYPQDPYLLAEQAAALISLQRGSEAIKTVDEGLQFASGYARLWSLKGAALDQMEQYDLARQHYNRALQITPQDPNIMSNLGLNYALSGDVAMAETWMRRAAAQPGAGANIQQNLDLILQLSGKAGTAPSTPQLRPNLRPAPQQQPYYGQPAQGQPTQVQPPQGYPQRGYPQQNYPQAGRPYSQARPPAQPYQGQPQAQPRPAAQYAPQSSYQGYGQPSPYVMQRGGYNPAMNPAAQNGKPVASTEDIFSKLSNNVGPRQAQFTAQQQQGQMHYPQARAQYQYPQQAEFQGYTPRANLRGSARQR